MKPLYSRENFLKGFLPVKTTLRACDYKWRLVLREGRRHKETVTSVMNTFCYLLPLSSGLSLSFASPRPLPSNLRQHNRTRDSDIAHLVLIPSPSSQLIFRVFYSHHVKIPYIRLTVSCRHLCLNTTMTSQNALG